MAHDLNRKIVAYGYLADHIPSGEKTELPFQAHKICQGQMPMKINVWTKLQVLFNLS